MECAVFMNHVIIPTFRKAPCGLLAIKTLQDNQQAIEKALMMDNKACIEIL
jgi:hypothetical protein